MRFILSSSAGGNAPGSTTPITNSDALLRDLYAVFARLGAVDIVGNPLAEVNAIYELCCSRGEPCVFVCLADPGRVPLGLKCPTYPVFAWAYSTIPDETWGGSPGNNWLANLEACSGTVVFSSFAARSVRSAMGEAFRVCTIAAPLWDRLSRERTRLAPTVRSTDKELCFRGIVFDSRTIDYSPDRLIPPVRPNEAPATSVPVTDAPTKKNDRWHGRLAKRLMGDAAPVVRSFPIAAPPAGPIELPAIRLQVAGVVYTSVLDLNDWSKNWFDMVSAFCWAFRETSDAVLIMKITCDNLIAHGGNLNLTLSRLAPFQCRVIVIGADVDYAAYEQLIDASTYIVQTSECEGLDLPLMEFMACGRPAIAPSHTAMEDFIDPGSAFVIRSSQQLGTRPHDGKAKIRPERFRFNWRSLFDAYRESYRVAKSAPDHYFAMSRTAQDRIRNISSDEAVATELHAFFGPNTISRAPIRPKYATAVAK